MKKNIGKIDKTLRIVLGLAIIAYGIIEQTYLGVIGLVPLFTGVISWCPLYCPFKISSCKDGSCDSSR